MKLSEKLLHFHFFFKAFVAYIVAHFADLQVSPDQKTDLADAWTDWLSKFSAYTDPNTHNSISISDINEAYNNYYPLSETVKTAIRDNSGIILSGADLINLDIKKRKANKTPINPPDFAPSLAATIIAHLSVTVFGFDPEHPTRKAKPDGAALFGYKIAFTEKDAPEPAPEAFIIQVPSGKTLFEIIYGLDKVGKRLWIIGWYISPTGKLSQVSVAISVVLV